LISGDVSTGLLMKRFYHCLMMEKQEPGSALAAVQAWLRDNTVRELGLLDLQHRFAKGSDEQSREAFEAVQFYASRPESKPFAHPYYWAPFVFTVLG
jgi:CHAT domain-containing protein